MNRTLFFLVILILFSCKKGENLELSPADKNSESKPEYHLKEQAAVKINTEQNTIRERFAPPSDYKWVESTPNSYGHFLENFKLKPYGTKILKYDGTAIPTQNLHEAVFDISVGNRDLQQCADAIIRLRAEYLYKTKKFSSIKFHFTSGDLLSWEEYKYGKRAFIKGKTVNFRKTSAADSSYQNFHNYLNLIYNYAGTISQFKETKQVSKNPDLQTGDLLITAGSPGHVVFIAGVSENKHGERLYLLAEGFTPAQSVSVMKNPLDKVISPWYKLNVEAHQIRTARYNFKPVHFRRY